ncbi:hypothetical protein B5M09_014057 [Aphanomyces astaci]|uniref:Uncharacterized protein n=1 Tax=Aphanomyces astaci TaxID=112090 RepID=A0A425CQ38_APHAT|nr:hypothetical protein B5M09_014057 [Aphanomyces astaci]
MTTPHDRKAVIQSRPRWNVDVTDLLVLRERREGRRRTSMVPRRQPGSHSMTVNNLPSELSMAPAKMTVERNALSANNRDTVRAELKAKRAVKAKIAEDDREQRWIRLNGVFEVPYCPDTGADQNVLPQRMLKELMTLQPDLVMVTLKEPMIGMACNNLPFQANNYVDLALQLQTAAGPVKIPGKRRCYVVAEGDEFLASDDTLKAIGIDIDRLLEQVATLQLWTTEMTWRKMVTL